MIGGGYATGRELVEFFLSSGPVHGLFGMLVTTILFSLAAALSFELARLGACYDYRSFFRALLGRFWIAYELAYLVLGLLVLAVIGAAAGEIAAGYLGLPRAAGTLLLAAGIGLLSWRGTQLIETVFAGWSTLLYLTYAVLLTTYLWRFGDGLAAGFAREPIRSGWFGSGLAYFGYNAAVLPLILFSVRHMHSRADAFTAGALAGPLVMLPALLFFLAMAIEYPAITGAAIPSDYLLRQLDLPLLQVIFYVVVLGTLVQTGTAFVHAINERVDAVCRERGRAMPRWLRGGVALLVLFTAIACAGAFGLIELIARGYGTLAWIFMALYILPLLTVGTRRILRTAA